MKVMKFGGAVLNSFDGFFRMVEILKGFQSEKLLIVVSAFAKSTRNLQPAAKTAESGNFDSAFQIISDFIDEHIEFSNKLIRKQIVLDSLTKEIKTVQKNLTDYIRGIAITAELSSRILDTVLSFGELLALKVTGAYLKEQQFNFESVDSTSIIVTDSKFGNASPLKQVTAAKINKSVLPLFDKKSIILTQGFVARDSNKDITTMGIESSNLTAAIYAGFLWADELIIWTDVEGIRTADPKIAMHTKSIPLMSRIQALSASLHGLKLIYPSMLEYADEFDFNIVFRSAFKPLGESTTITSKTNNNPFLIISNSGLYYLSKNDRESEFIFNIPKLNHLISEFSFSADMSEILIQEKSYKEMKNLSKYWNIVKGYSLITLFNPVINEETFNILERFIRIEKIKFTFNGFNNRLLIIAPDQFAEKLIRFLHTHFII